MDDKLPEKLEKGKTYRFVGIVGGYIWLPQVLAVKDIYNDNKFSTDEHKPFYYHAETVEDILDRITNDGDFQSCEIVEGRIEVTYWEKLNRREVTEYYDLEPDDYPDHFANEERRFELMDIWDKVNFPEEY